MGWRARVEEVDARLFNAHSLAVAVLSDQAALELPVPYPEGAFTAGLLHDVGKLLIAVALPERFEKMHLPGRRRRGKRLRDRAGHHSPEQAGGGAFHLAHLIETADHYINAAGFGMPRYRHHPATGFEQRYQELGLKDCILKVANTFKAEFEAVRTFF